VAVFTSAHRYSGSAPTLFSRVEHLQRVVIGRSPISAETFTGPCLCRIACLWASDGGCGALAQSEVNARREIRRDRARNGGNLINNEMARINRQ